LIQELFKSKSGIKEYKTQKIKAKNMLGPVIDNISPKNK